MSPLVWNDVNQPRLANMCSAKTQVVVPSIATPSATESISSNPVPPTETSVRSPEHDQEAVTPGTFVGVFLDKVGERNLYSVNCAFAALHRRTLVEICAGIANFFKIDVEHQLVTVLRWPDVSTYNMSLVSEEEARRVIVPDGCCVMASRQPKQVVAKSCHVLRKVWTPSFTTRRECPKGYEESVRNRMTFMLDNVDGVNLQVISELSQYSKAALSLWRRGKYTSDAQELASAVNEALVKLDTYSAASNTNHMPYDPSKVPQSSKSTVIVGLNNRTKKRKVSSAQINVEDEDTASGESGDDNGWEPPNVPDEEPLKKVARRVSRPRKPISFAAIEGYGDDVDYEDDEDDDERRGFEDE